MRRNSIEHEEKKELEWPLKYNFIRLSTQCTHHTVKQTLMT